VQEFNKGVYDYIIATDESGGKGEEDVDSEDGEDTEALESEESDVEGEAKTEGTRDAEDANSGEMDERKCCFFPKFVRHTHECYSCICSARACHFKLVFQPKTQTLVIFRSLIQALQT
jgi:hypothetical protein